MSVSSSSSSDRKSPAAREPNSRAEPESAPNVSVALPGSYVREPAPASPPQGSRSAGAATTNRHSWGAAQNQPARPTPLPKRPKGRLFVAALLLVLIGVVAIAVWNTFLRYDAYGTVEGRVIQVSVPWEGQLRSIDVREGDHVETGQLLLTVENLRDEAQLAKLGDDLRIAQANLQAKTAELRLNSQLHGDRLHKAQAEYYEIWGNYLHEQARLRDLQAQHKRIDLLRQRSAVSNAQDDEVRLAEEGQRAKVEKLKSALEEMQKRVAAIEVSEGTEPDELKPCLVHLEAIQAEMARLHEQLQRGQVRAPTGGRVIRRLRFTGERAAVAEPVLELLEDDSLHVVVYLPQSRSTLLSLGQEVTVYVDSQATAITCTVDRFGDRFESAPPALARFHSPGEPLLPVYLRPISPSAGSALRLGALVKLPRSLGMRWWN